MHRGLVIRRTIVGLELVQQGVTPSLIGIWGYQPCETEMSIILKVFVYQLRMLVKFGICRQQNINILMCCGIILLDVYLIVAGEKVHLAYSIIAVVFI